MSAPRLRLLPSHDASVPARHAFAAGMFDTAVAQPWRQNSPTAETLGISLLRDGLVAPHDMVQALALQNQRRGRLVDILLARRMVAEPLLFSALSRHWGAPLVDVAAQTADARLIDRLGATSCIRDGLLPWRKVGGATVIVTAFPEDFPRHHARLTAEFGQIIMGLAPTSAVEEAILRIRGPALDLLAQTRVAAAESCRDWGSKSARLVGALAIILLLCGVWFAPLVLGLVATFWAILTLLMATALKTAAVFAALRRKPPENPPPIIARLPTVSVMVALYREGDIAPRLIRRLSRLDYPRELLDILLVVEQDDKVTRNALQDTDLPPWMRVIVVPNGRLKTKPRALNYALNACRGSIIGIYDAEDAPEPDQIRKIVDRFHQRGADVACLQGVLDFYNPNTNWLSRCFTMEYSTWFRIILPGLERLGLAIPLGGTTLFFRRAALEELGAWDAHNVTEDADLGMRLARHGYRTELIDTVTEEEANCRTLPWIRQRSRWLKGYMMTYMVHMRDPSLLLRQLGPWKFAGFQVFFLSTLSQFLLAPVLWSFWVLPFGIPHPVAAALSPVMLNAIIGLFLFTEALLLVITLISLRLTPNKINPLWAPVMHFYFPLGALASYKAAWELIARPFYWDKTSHGHFDPLEPPP